MEDRNRCRHRSRERERQREEGKDQYGVNERMFCIKTLRQTNHELYPESDSVFLYRQMLGFCFVFLTYSSSISFQWSKCVGSKGFLNRKKGI